MQCPVEDGAPACGEVAGSLCEVAIEGGVGVCGRRAGGEAGDAEGFFVGDGGGVNARRGCSDARRPRPKPGPRAGVTHPGGVGIIIPPAKDIVESTGVD